MPSNRRLRPRFDRRRFVQVSGLAGLAAVAGCLGDDDPDADDDVNDADDTDVADEDDVDDVDDVDDIDDTDDGDDGDDADDADDEPAIERHDAMPLITRGPPLPADCQYNRFNDPVPMWQGEGTLIEPLVSVSFGNNQIEPVIVDSWNYQPGLLEFTIHDNVFWWSGDRMTIEDYINELELQNYMWGGDELDAHDNIVAYEAVDEYTARLSLADTWRERWALSETIEGNSIGYSRGFSGPWLEQFEDAADLDAIEDLREAVSEERHTDDEDLVHNFHSPFEFRLDGSIGEVQEEHWELELVPEKNGTTRLFADEINFTRWQLVARDEVGAAHVDQFLAGDEPTMLIQWVQDADEAPFETKDLIYDRPFEQWGFTFNNEIHPADNVNFRRAWAYLTDHTLWEAPAMFPLDNTTPFFTDERLEQFVSQEVVDAHTDYKTDEIAIDDAEEEMIGGGFERNGNGQWLMQEDGASADAGEPIEFTVESYDWMPEVPDLGSDFWTDVNEFGINAEVILEGVDPWTVSARYSGGGMPELVFSSTFGEDNLSWAAPNPNLPSTIEAAPVGDEDGDPVEFDTRAMADRLPVTTEEAAYQDLVDQLAWCANQVLPRYTVVTVSRWWVANDERWRYPDPANAPEKFINDPIWTLGIGALSYVPEDER